MTLSSFTPQAPAEAHRSQLQRFRHDVIAGLRERPKRLPCKYFYDRRGSLLFDQICELDEYYLTRTELQIMQKNAAEIAECIGAGVMLVEYGSGSSTKTRILLDHLDDPVAYVPVDISRAHLHEAAQSIAADYPQIEVLPVHVDFTKEFHLPQPKRRATHAAVYFPGSTIGNFVPAKARELLGRIAPLCGTGGGLLIGVDLQKPVDILESAYNDREGVTAAFNLNLLERINRELGGDFDLASFEHRAIYNDEFGRVEMHLVSLVEQAVTIADHTFEFAPEETICTEFSHKHTIEGFAAQAAEVGLTLRRSWTDPEELFAVMHLVVET